MSGHTPTPKWETNDHGWCMEADEYENQEKIVACVNALAAFRKEPKQTKETR